MRMKNHMISHVNATKMTMFEAAADASKSLLRQMCNSLESELASKMEVLFETVSRDYTAVLVGGDANAGAMAATPRTERLICGSMLAALTDADEAFVDLQALSNSQTTFLRMSEDQYVGIGVKMENEDESLAEVDGSESRDEDEPMDE
jgi:hypothetical protein